MHPIKIAAGVFAGDVQEFTGSRALRGLLAYNGGLSKEELRCSVDTQKLYKDNPALDSVVMGVADSIDVQEEGLAIELTLKDDYVTNLTAACSKASGLFLPMNNEDFLCEYQGLEVEVMVKNFAQCLAETPECDKEDPVKLLEEVWDAMDLECREKGEPAPPQTQKPYYTSSASSDQARQSQIAFQLAAGVASAILVAGVLIFLVAGKRLKGTNNSLRYPTYEMSRQEEHTLT